MATLDESNLLAMKARAAKFRTHHVGTKLNEAELREFEALAEKRKQTPSELIRKKPGDRRDVIMYGRKPDIAVPGSCMPDEVRLLEDVLT